MKSLITVIRIALILIMTFTGCTPSESNHRDRQHEEYDIWTQDSETLFVDPCASTQCTIGSFVLENLNGEFYDGVRKQPGDQLSFDITVENATNHSVAVTSNDSSVVYVLRSEATPTRTRVYLSIRQEGLAHVRFTCLETGEQEDVLIIVRGDRGPADPRNPAKW